GMAVLGCGRIGRMHARNLARHPRARLVMVFDVLAEAAQQTATELGVKIARSVDEVLSAGEVGGVLVATPTDTHVPLIAAAVRAGKAVLCEKRSEEHTSELQSLRHLVCRLLLEKKKQKRQVVISA